MDQLLLSIKVIITSVLKPVIVKDKILLILRVNVTVVLTPACFMVFTSFSSHCNGPIVAYYKS